MSGQPLSFQLPLAALQLQPPDTCRILLVQLYKNDRLSVSSTENSAIESHPQTVSQYSSFSEMTALKTLIESLPMRVKIQTHSYLVQPCLARSLQLYSVSKIYCPVSTRHGIMQPVAGSRRERANIAVSRESAVSIGETARESLTISSSSKQPLHRPNKTRSY